LFDHYHEPFMGGAALLLRLSPERATLSDSNAELVNCYRVVRDDVETLIEHLAIHQNESDYFYETRAADPMRLTDVGRASRFIYLNRTCFNGLYRVNRQGRFNTPFGRYSNPRICDAVNLRLVSAALRSVELLEADYFDALALAESGDFAYLDPPYMPVSKFSDFKRYTKEQFGEAEHVRLAEVFRELDARGCKVMLSNSDTPLVHELYRGYTIEVVRARRLINKNPEGRGLVNELVIRNYEH
ncbi:MAG: Dam family site-specific DNA-(adenine-N6)-methyltransferase, partial [Actinomycetes bacterium]